jgi:hypothetical protein
MSDSLPNKTLITVDDIYNIILFAGFIKVKWPENYPFPKKVILFKGILSLQYEMNLVIMEFTCRQRKGSFLVKNSLRLKFSDNEIVKISVRNNNDFKKYIKYLSRKQVCVFVSQKLPGVFDTRQTCLFLPMVANG